MPQRRPGRRHAAPLIALASMMLAAPDAGGLKLSSPVPGALPGTTAHEPQLDQLMPPALPPLKGTPAPAASPRAPGGWNAAPASAAAPTPAAKPAPAKPAPAKPAPAPAASKPAPKPLSTPATALKPSPKPSTPKAAQAPVRAAPTTPAPTARSSSLVWQQVASQWLGTRYVLGGNSKSGIDCSAFTQRVMASVGIRLPRTSAAQSRVGQQISRTQLRPGDLVFFNTSGRGVSHVGLYIGAGLMANANSYAGRVKVEPMNSSYWSPRYTGARRVMSALQAGNDGAVVRAAGYRR